MNNNNLKLIIGLGNIGDKFNFTRHNIGFNLIDELAEKLNIKFEKKQFDGIFGFNQDNNIILFKPCIFMNNSGIAIKKIIDFYKIDIKNLLVIFDDMDTNIGEFKLKDNSSSGGHNGIKNIIECLNTKEFKRIKIGISRPLKNIDIKDYVLAKFSEKELSIIKKIINKVCDVIISFLKDWDFQKAMSLFNNKKYQQQ